MEIIAVSAWLFIYYYEQSRKLENSIIKEQS